MSNKKTSSRNLAEKEPLRAKRGISTPPSAALAAVFFDGKSILQRVEERIYGIQGKKGYPLSFLKNA
ncbi:hypothetical protein FVE67_01920 [Thermosulfurimonas marina]|uniref:Uncharacterized protein n=1 Tax=Thermosulfurimonas marina TaxID=2047767 RepID=A0A6H1WR44_9BACT|nr:hypothetical protein [Thermosulfurimonas marina]QJA05629.1 hypothetical protein FVE67_01920 [Thermosulfurimonas marina]